MKGYYGINWAAVFLIAAGVGGYALTLAATDENLIPLYFGLALLILGQYVGGFFVVFPQAKRIVFGTQMSAGWALGFTLATTFCLGIIGLALMQFLAMSHMGNYGVKSGLLGPKKKVLLARIEELRNQPKAPPVVPPVL